MLKILQENPGFQPIHTFEAVTTVPTCQIHPAYPYPIVPSPTSLVAMGQYDEAAKKRSQVTRLPLTCQMNNLTKSFLPAHEVHFGSRWALSRNASGRCNWTSALQLFSTSLSHCQEVHGGLRDGFGLGPRILLPPGEGLRGICARHPRSSCMCLLLTHGSFSL